MSTETTSRPLEQRDVESADEAKELICRIARLFYTLGWVTGTGGGLSIKHDQRIYMAPSGVQKEYLTPAMIFELDLDGKVVAGPDADSGLRVSQCQPLFMHAYNIRGAGAVLHSHSMAAMLATLQSGSHFTVTHLEMLKGIKGVGYQDVHSVPIIDNTPHESDLADSLAAAIEQAEPNCHAVLVRRHGVYVWGDTWVDAKRHVECYDYLFQAANEMRKLGIDPAAIPAN